MKATLLALSTAVLLGCSAATPPRPTTPRRVLVLGNSITRHAPDPAIGWSGDWGMAATDSANDFAHRLSAEIGPLAGAVNVANLETAPATFDWANLGAVLSVGADVIVIELGDNVADVGSVAPAYRALVDSARAHAPQVLCTTTWWNNYAMNALVRSACTGPGRSVVDISRFYANTATRGAGAYPNAAPAVGQHPGDRGMELIANAIASEVR